MPRSKNTKIYCLYMKEMSNNVTEAKFKLVKELQKLFTRKLK